MIEDKFQKSLNELIATALKMQYSDPLNAKTWENIRIELTQASNRVDDISKKKCLGDKMIEDKFQKSLNELIATALKMQYSDPLNAKTWENIRIELTQASNRVDDISKKK